MCDSIKVLDFSQILFRKMLIKESVLYDWRHSKSRPNVRYAVLLLIVDYNAIRRVCDATDFTHDFVF